MLKRSLLPQNHLLLIMYKFAIVFLITVPFYAKAQTVTTGTVYDYSKKYLPVPGVIVRNLNTRVATVTSSKGKFTLGAKVGEVLEFSLLGYHTDTLYLTNLLEKQIYLPEQSNALNDVDVRAVKINSAILNARDSTAEKPTLLSTGGNLQRKGMRDKVGGLTLNLGYGKYRRQQIAEQKIEEKERYLDQIDERFNPKSISEYIKLTAEEMKDFMVLYRPSVERVTAEQPFNYTLYIVRAIGAWKKLTPKQRKLQDLPKLK